ncbi:hypothetical protein D3C77_409340 [compost metagenome]
MLPHLQRRLAVGLPLFTLHLHRADVRIAVIDRHHRGQAADQPGIATDQRAFACFHGHAQHATEQQCREQREEQDQRQRNAETGYIGVHQDHRTHDKGDDAAKTDHTKAGHERLGNHEGHAEQNQCYPGVTHR